MRPEPAQARTEPGEKAGPAMLTFDVEFDGIVHVIGQAPSEADAEARGERGGHEDQCLSCHFLFPFFEFVYLSASHRQMPTNATQETAYHSSVIRFMVIPFNFNLLFGREARAAEYDEQREPRMIVDDEPRANPERSEDDEYSGDVDHVIL